MSNPSQPAEWLGLLKWSLSYTDGTRNDNISPMSPEDRAFLEEVMKHGIVNESERMKEILSELTLYFDSQDDTVSSPSTPDKQEEIENLLLELRDLVGLIDYAKMFTVMGGASLLMAIASFESSSSWIPSIRIRTTCMIVLATLCQNNPSVQKTMIDQGHLVRLMHLFISLFQHIQIRNSNEMNIDEKQDRTWIASMDELLLFSTRIMQAISASVRDFVLAEEVFCKHELSSRCIENGLGIWMNSPLQDESILSSSRWLMLRKKTLFFLQALITSDTSNASRLSLFQTSIDYIARHCLHSHIGTDVELREMSLSFFIRIYERQYDSNMDENTHLFLQEFMAQRCGIDSSTNLHEHQDQEDDEQEELLLCQQLHHLLLTRTSRSVVEASQVDSIDTNDAVTATHGPMLMLLPASADRSHETIPQ